MSPKEDSPLSLSSSRPTFSCALYLPTNKRLGTSLLHCLLVATRSPLRSISETQETPVAQPRSLKRSLFIRFMDSEQKRK